MKKIILAACFIAVAAACKKPAPPPETVPVPKTDAAVSESTVAVRPVCMLQVPGNYIRTTVGQVEKARAAKALFEKTAAEESKQRDLNDNGGN